MNNYAELEFHHIESHGHVCIINCCYLSRGNLSCLPRRNHISLHLYNRKGQLQMTLLQHLPWRRLSGHVALIGLHKRRYISVSCARTTLKYWMEIFEGLRMAKVESLQMPRKMSFGKELQQLWIVLQLGKEMLNRWNANGGNWDLMVPKSINFGFLLVLHTNCWIYIEIVVSHNDWLNLYSLGKEQ